MQSQGPSETFPGIAGLRKREKVTANLYCYAKIKDGFLAFQQT